MIDPAEWDDRMEYHAPTPAARESHDALISAWKMVGRVVLAVVPAGREQALVLTKLEEAKFWASAGVARNQ